MSSQEQNSSSSVTSVSGQSSEGIVVSAAVESIDNRDVDDDEDHGHEVTVIGQRGPKKDMPLWKYFSEVRTADGVFSVCQQRGCKYRNKGRNTTTLKNHLAKHPEQYEEFMKLYKSATEWKRKLQSDKNRLQSDVTEFFPNNSVVAYDRNFTKFKVMKKSLTQLAACTSMSLNLVSSEEFREYTAALDARGAASLPSRYTLKNWIITWTNDMQHAVVDNIRRARKFSVCCDMWSQQGLTHSFIGVTVQYYNKDNRRLETAALSCRELPHPHTADAIRNEVLKILSDWGLDEANVLRYITDQGANMIAAFRSFVIIQSCAEDADESSDDTSDDGSDQVTASDAADAEAQAFFDNVAESERVFPRRNSCYAHVMNVACHTVLDMPMSQIQKLREKVLSIVRKFAASGVATEKLKAMAGKKLIKVAQTRWNSFYYVCCRVYELKEHVVAICAAQDWPITFAWSDVELCCELLKPIADAITYVKVIHMPPAQQSFLVF